MFRTTIRRRAVKLMRASSRQARHVQVSLPFLRILRADFAGPRTDNPERTGGLNSPSVFPKVAPASTPPTPADVETKVLRVCERWDPPREICLGILGYHVKVDLMILVFEIVRHTLVCLCRLAAPLDLQS